MTYFAESLETPSKPAPNALEVETIRRARRLHLFRYNQAGEERSAEDQLALAAAERQRCADDFFYWIDNYGWLHDPHAEDAELSIIPFMLWPAQRELAAWFIEGIETGRNRHLNKARSIGASWLCLHIFMHRFLFHKGFTAKCGSRKEELVDDRTMDSLFGKLRFIYRRQPGFFKPDKKDFIDNYLLLQNATMGSEITGEATNVGFGRGGRKQAVLFDEFAWVETAIQAQAWTSLETVARCVLDISTPNGKGNQFHQNCVRSPEQDRRTVNWKANPRRTQEWFDGLLVENGGRLTWDARAQEHDCFVAGTIVLTHRGGIPIETVVEGDIVLTHTGRWRKVEATRKKPYGGGMVEVKSLGGLPFVCTPSHPVLTTKDERTFSWTEAGSLTAEHRLCFPKLKLGEAVISAEMAEILAWFVAEGSVARTAVSFSLGKSEVESGYSERIRRCLSFCGFSSSVIEGERSNNVMCYSSVLSDFLTAHCGSGAIHKRLPMHLLGGHEKLVFETLLDADGCRNGERFNYCTISPGLAHQVQALAIACGLACGVGVAAEAGEGLFEGRKVRISKRYQVQGRLLPGNVKQSKIRFSKNHVTAPVTAVSHVEPVERFIYNLQVSTDNSYTVFGRAAHNCNFAGVGGYRVLKADREKITYNDEKLFRLYPKARAEWVLPVAGDVGSGPSQTAFSFGLINWSLGDGVDPLILIDNEVVRERQTAYDIARDVKLELAEYGGRRAIFGDPASKNVDSVQESWETNLQSGGIPFVALPPWYNDQFAIGETLKDIQRLIDKGLLLVHERCLYAHEAIESWEWDIPKGMSIELLSRDTLKPKKNVYSHMGDSLRYLVGFALRGLRPGATNPLSRPSGPPPEPKPGEIDRGLKRDEFINIPTDRSDESAARSIQRVSSSLTGHKGKILDFRNRSREI